MSTNTFRCRACGRPIAEVHHGGRTKFLTTAHRSEHGPPGTCWRLVCPCGEIREWMNQKG